MDPDKTQPAPVAVVIPTYNRRHEVARALRSVVEQTLPPREILVVDDGSSDGTPEAIGEEFGERVEVVRQANAGPSAARNRGIDRATSPWIAFLDSDDVWRADKLERQVPGLSDEIVLSFSNWGWSDAPQRGHLETLGIDVSAARVLDDAPAHAFRQPGHGIWLPACIARRSALLAAGRFDEGLRIGEDTRLVYRLAWLGAFRLEPEVLVTRGESLSGEQLTRRSDDAYRSVQRATALEVLFEAWARADRASPDVRARIRRLLVFYLNAQAGEAAREGDARRAREKALQALALRPTGRALAKALAAAVWPRLLARGGDA